MHKKMLYMLKAIHEEIIQEKSGKQPLNGEEFEKEETTLSLAVKKYLNQAAIKISAPLKNQT